MKIQAKRIEFEWSPQDKKKSISKRCWNSRFWYGDGTPATAPSVVIRYRDYLRLLKAARAAANGTAQ